MKITVHADGGSRGNPGPAAIGVVVLDDKKNELETYKEFLGKKTNNEAEYLGLIKALELASKHTHDEVEVVMDSELVVKQMLGEYKLKAENLKHLFYNAQKYLAFFKKVKFSNVPREHHWQCKADALVNQALDEKK